MLALKILIIILIIVFAFFLITFGIYMFNLDMKMAAALTPVMNKIYDMKKKSKKKAHND